MLKQSAPTSNPITVCSSGCNYSHIQDAINASVPGDLILVEGGIYPETLTIPKMVTIQGRKWDGYRRRSKSGLCD